MKGSVYLTGILCTALSWGFPSGHKQIRVWRAPGSMLTGTGRGVCHAVAISFGRDMRGGDLACAQKWGVATRKGCIVARGLYWEH